MGAMAVFVIVSGDFLTFDFLDLFGSHLPILHYICVPEWKGHTF